MRCFEDFIETLNDEQKVNYEMYNAIRGKQTYYILFVCEGIFMDEIFDNKTIIIFDTNVWLDMYRNLPSTIKTIITALDKVDFTNRIYIPSFSIMEFEKHKIQLISEHKEINQKVKGALNEAINKGKKSIIEAIEIQKKRYKIENEKIERDIENLLINIEKKGNDFLSATAEDCTDTAYLGIENLFNKIKKNNTIDELSKNEILELFVIGENRYKKKIPPGFMDKKKEEKGGFIYGDLIIWKEIIAFSKRIKKDILFVTNDTKKDWFEDDLFSEKLVEEFKIATNRNITGISSQTFYEHTSINKGLDIVSFIEKITDELLQDLYDEINTPDVNHIFDPYLILSHYSGDYYEIEDIEEFNREKYAIHFDENNAEIKITINFEATIRTAEYSGRDDETKEVYLYPYHTHLISGEAVFVIEKEIKELFYNKTNYNIIDISGKCIEISCDTDSDYDINYF